MANDGKLLDAAAAADAGIMSNAMIKSALVQFIIAPIGRRVAITCALLLNFAYPAYASDPALPDPKLTPGAVLTTDTATVCRPGYSKSVRHTSGQLKHQIYAEYGIDRNAGHYEIDHLIPLGIGGADTRENLWPESHDTHPWNAEVKDRLENYLHVEICIGHIPLAGAQKAIAVNWIAAYLKYFESPTAAAGH